MKTILFGFSLMTLLSTSVFAHIEHREGDRMDAIPSSQACFAEMRNLDCGHPMEDQEYFVNCYRNNVTALSNTCRDLLEQLYDY
jgi:hypothetical protein